MSVRRLLPIFCSGMLFGALLCGACQTRQAVPATPPPGPTTVAVTPSAVLQLPLVGAAAEPTIAIPTLIGGPYLGDVTGSSAVVSWVTRGPGPSWLRYGQSGERTAEATTVTTPAGDWHSAILGGLEPGAPCAYAVYAGGEMALTPPITFTTAPPPGGADFTFLVLGDSRPGNRLTAEPSAGARRVAGQMARLTPAFVLHSGDITSEGGRCEGELSGWEQYLRAYFGLYGDMLSRTPFYVVPGNHELALGSCGYDIYTGIFALPRNAPAGDEEKYYSFDWGNAHITALDSEQSSAPGTGQYRWLERDLSATKQRWKFVFFHHAPYSSGEDGSLLSLRETWVPLFEKYGVDVVFSGHNHTYERTCPIRNGACTTVEDGGVVYVVTAGGGAVLHDITGDWFSQAYASVFHFVAVRVQGSQLTLQAVDHSGQVIDRWEMGAGSR